MTTNNKRGNPSMKKASTRKTKTQAPIQWFAQAVKQSKDLDRLRQKAKAEKYSDATIQTQIGRLRNAGLLPRPAKKAEKPAKRKKEIALRGPKTTATDNSSSPIQQMDT